MPKAMHQADRLDAERKHAPPASPRVVEQRYRLQPADLPAAGTAIPVTYEAGGEQYVVIAAGGHSMFGTTLGDSVVAYKLKR